MTPKVRTKPLLKPHYAGPLSTTFWAAVNALPEDQRGVAYQGGCKLQELEAGVLQLVNWPREEPTPLEVAKAAQRANAKEKP